MRKSPRTALFVVYCFFLLARVTIADDTKLSQQQIVDRLLASTMYVDMMHKSQGLGCGTAWLVDKEQRLLVTNDHVATPGNHEAGGPFEIDITGWFPERRAGRIVHDIRYYVRNVEPIKAKVIYSDKRNDLALLQVESIPENAQAIELSPESSQLGSRLHAMAGLPRGSEGLWIYTQGTTRAVYRRTLANDYYAQTLEADMQTNGGNSGGAVIDDTGRLVGVVEGHMEKVNERKVRSVSMYIDVEEVRNFLKVALPLAQPKTGDQYLDRGANHYENGRYGLAMSDFTQALRRDRKNALAISNRGWVFYQRDDLQTALAEFNDAIRLDSTLDYAYWGRAMVNHAIGEFEQAADDMSHAIRNCEDQEDLAQMYLDRAEFHLANEDYVASLYDTDRAIDARPKFGWAHACRGQMLAFLERFDEAAQAFSKAIDLDPYNAEILNLVGTALESGENYEDAIKQYTLAIKLSPRNPVFYANRGKAWRAAEYYGSAEEDLKKAIELSPEDADLYNELGLVYYRAGEYALAYKWFGEAIKRDGSELIYWLNRGDAALQAGDARRAIENFTEVIRYEDDADTYALRGEAHQLLGNTQAAKKDYAKAIELAPEVYRMFNAKYLQIANETSEPLKVYVQWYTKSKSGSYRWYPGNGKTAAIFTFQPDQKSVLISPTNKQIYGARFHVWAVGMNSGMVFDGYKDKDLILVHQGGYVTDSNEPETELFRFVGSD